MAASAAIAVSMAVPAVFAWLSARAGEIGAYRIGSMVMVVCGAVAAWLWPPPLDVAAREPLSWWRAATGAAAAGACAYGLAWKLLPVMFAGAPDPNRGDMLLIIESGAREFLAGRMPYRMFHVPWDAPLSYGPGLWLPFSIPILLRADLRTLTLACLAFVPAVTLFGAALSLSRRQWVAGVCVAALAIGFAIQPQVLAFYPIAHTPAYWPLIVLFCVLLTGDRWTAAAATLGLLVCARTTMASIVPVFLIAAYYRGRLTIGVLAWLAAMSAGPFVPFLIKDAAAVRYGMFGVYVHVIKDFVWPQPTVIHTYGLTGWMLAHHLNAYVDLAQWICMAVVYLAAWRPLACGARPEPWMALALLVFSMTTWWPVIYVYFDVWILLTAALLAASRVPFTSPGRAALTLGLSVVIVMAALLGRAARAPGASPVVDVGTPAAAPFTGAGFGTDEPSYEGDRNFVWVTDTIARVRLPRAGWGAAEIAIDIQPYAPIGARQTVAASLNGKSVGMTTLSPGWQTITFHGRRQDWNYGFNLLTLYFGYALPETQRGRNLSVGIDRVLVR